MGVLARSSGVYPRLASTSPCYFDNCCPFTPPYTLLLLLRRAILSSVYRSFEFQDSMMIDNRRTKYSGTYPAHRKCEINSTAQSALVVKFDSECHWNHAVCCLTGHGETDKILNWALVAYKNDDRGTRVGEPDQASDLTSRDIPQVPAPICASLSLLLLPLLPLLWALR